MVTQSPTVTLLEPGAPPWAQRFALRLQQVFSPVRPVQPVRVWAALKADLPPPADWPWTLVIVTDQNCLAVSNGTSWQKLAFGGPV